MKYDVYEYNFFLLLTKHQLKPPVEPVSIILPIKLVCFSTKHLIPITLPSSSNSLYELKCHASESLQLNGSNTAHYYCYNK